MHCDSVEFITEEDLSIAADNIHGVLHADFVDVRVVLRSARFCNIMSAALRQGGAAPFVVAFFEAQSTDLITKAVDMLDAVPPSGEMH